VRDSRLEEGGSNSNEEDQKQTRNEGSHGGDVVIDLFCSVAPKKVWTIAATLLVKPGPRPT
jgi:hypothetical protein